MTLGALPVNISYDDLSECGGPVVRLRTSRAWSTRYGQKETGHLLATRLDLTTSMMLRMARSATPLSECTCGGQVVCVMPAESKNSVNSRERNSPALNVEDTIWP